MSDDTKDSEVGTSVRQRRRTRRAKRRRALRVPVDDVPRRSIADDGVVPAPVLTESMMAPAGPRHEVVELDEAADEPTDVTEVAADQGIEGRTDVTATDELSTDISVQADELEVNEPVVTVGPEVSESDLDEATDVSPTLPEDDDEPVRTRPSARVVVRGTVRVSDVPPALIASEFAVDDPAVTDAVTDAAAQAESVADANRGAYGDDDEPEVHIEVASPDEVDAGDQDLVGDESEWGSDEGDLLWREEQSRELRILEPTQDEAVQIAAAVEDEGVDVDVGVAPPPEAPPDAAAANEPVVEPATAPPERRAKPVRPPPPPSGSNGARSAAAASEAGALEAEEPPPKAKRRRPWFETFFNDDYLRTVPPPPDVHVGRQCDFIERSLNLEKGATILDVGCGLGLHAVELSSRGYLVVGLDLSLPMLSRAADEAQDRNLKINFLHGDMREMTFDGAFDAVLCWGTTLGYFDDEMNKRVVERFYQALKPGGMLLIDVVNRDYVVRSQPNLVWFEGDGCVCMEETQFNFIKARLEVKRTVILDDGRQRESYYSIRLYAFHELGQLLHQQGFRVGSVSGHEAIPGVFFGADAPRMLVLAARRRDLPGARSPSLRNLRIPTADTPPPPPPEGALPPTPPKTTAPPTDTLDSSEEEPEDDLGDDED